jgi:hypothetical protein
MGRGEQGIDCHTHQAVRMNLPQQSAAFHDAKYAHGKALACEKRVNDYDHSNGRRTSKRGAEYWDWIHKHYELRQSQ